MLDAWTKEVEYLTREHREARAAELSAKGKALRLAWARFIDGDPDDPRKEPGVMHEAKTRASFHATSPGAWQLETQGFPTLGGAALPSKVQNKGDWHMSRARGHRERFERVGDCQQLETMKIQCRHCPYTSERGVRCRVALACVSCRGKIANEKRCRLATNRRVTVDLIAKRGLLRHNAKGGRWSEKLLTLTLPPTPELDITSRILFLRRAWTPFARGWNDWLRRHPSAGCHLDRQGHSLARWFRNVEWTRGEGGDNGHPHVHMWFIGPYVPGARAADDPAVSVIRNLWRDAIRQAAQSTEGGALLFPSLAARIGPARLPHLGRRADVTRLPPSYWRGEISGLAELVVDVRACKPGPGSLQEVIKYLFKDTIAGGTKKLPPEVWAQVYEGFDGVRTTQGSRGLMSLELRERLFAAYLVNERTGEVREVELEDIRDLGDLPKSVTGCACPSCGTRGAWMVGRRRMTDEERHALDARRPLARGAGRRQTRFFEKVAIA